MKEGFGMRKKHIGICAVLLACLLAVSACGGGSGKALPEIGAAVTFGRYEQDNNPDNGPEPIEWTVLEAKDGKVLLLSRYGLDTQPYNTVDGEVTWETCTLRAWLNGDFSGAAFTEKERSAILTTDVDNGPGQGYSGWETDGGSNTKDQVFLLSCAEAARYFAVKYYDEDDGSNTASRVKPTAYAVARGAWEEKEYRTADGSPAGLWWLRSPGESLYSAASVDFSGPLWYVSVTNKENCVRPAVWVDWNSDVFK